MGQQLITLEQLLGPYSEEPWTPEELSNGRVTCERMNALCKDSESARVVLVDNPKTKNAISGEANGARVLRERWLERLSPSTNYCRRSIATIRRGV